MKIKILNRNNWISIIFIFIIFLFFSQTLLYTWKTASPYCRADDWRFIDIYLKPFYNGDLQLKDLWSDPTHPLPVYATFFIGSAKYFSLQIHYIARVAIFFQLFLGILIIFSFTKSLNGSKTISLLPIIAVISLCSIIFSFIVQTPYTWAIMTSCYLGSFLVLIVGYFSDRYYLQTKTIYYKSLITIGLTLIISFLLYSDWTVIFCLSLLLVLIIIFCTEKIKRNKIILLGSTLIISLLIGLFLFTFYLKQNPSNLNINITDSLTLFTDNPILTLKSISIGMFSGILNFKWFVNTFEPGKKLYIIFSLIFMFTYLVVLVIYFTKRLYNKSILPPTMMIYSLVFILSVLFFRYNPVDNGMLCLYWPRYIQFYQIGIIGYLWSLFLILNSVVENKPKLRNGILVLSCSITLILIVLWTNDYRINSKTSKYLKERYPEVSCDIRDKLNNNEIEIPWSNQPNRDISQQLKFLHDHELNVFAPNYPYSAFTEKSFDP